MNCRRWRPCWPTSTRRRSTRARSVSPGWAGCTRRSSSARRARRMACTGRRRRAKSPARWGRPTAPPPARDGAYHGYYFRILTGQGKNANGGAYDYRIKGRMSAGFALIAWPAQYGKTGIMSFMVNHDGVVFQKNLGPGGDAVARAHAALRPRCQLAGGGAGLRPGRRRDQVAQATPRARRAYTAVAPASRRRRGCMHDIALNELWTLVVALLTIGLGSGRHRARAGAGALLHPAGGGRRLPGGGAAAGGCSSWAGSSASARSRAARCCWCSSPRWA